MSWSIEFAPMVPAPLFWAAGLVALALIILMLVKRSRGAAWRAAAVAALFARSRQSDLARGGARRPRQHRPRRRGREHEPGPRKAPRAVTRHPGRARERASASIKNLEVKWITAAKPEDGAGQGTQLFAALNTALTNTAPDRIAGVIMVTDGQVHDVPKSTAQLGFDAPVHALLTGTPGRVRPPHRDHRKRRATASSASRARSSSPCANPAAAPGSSRPVTLQDPPRGPPRRDPPRRHRQAL